jgi:hypothetical protein
LYYSHNEGSFTQVITTSSVIKSVSSTHTGYNDGDDATELLTTHTTYLANNNSINEGDADTDTFVWLGNGPPSQGVETEWVVRLVPSDLSPGDTIELRLRDEAGIVFNGGYTKSPIISVQRARVSVRGAELSTQGEEVSVK